MFDISSPAGLHFLTVEGVKVDGLVLGVLVFGIDERSVGGTTKDGVAIPEAPVDSETGVTIGVRCVIEESGGREGFRLCEFTLLSSAPSDGCALCLKLSKQPQPGTGPNRLIGEEVPDTDASLRDGSRSSIVGEGGEGRGDPEGGGLPVGGGERALPRPHAQVMVEHSPLLAAVL